VINPVVFWPKLFTKSILTSLVWHETAT